MTQHETEISSWAYITHVPIEGRSIGGVYTAFDRETGKKAGELYWFWLDTPRTRIKLKDVEVPQTYRRRKVAKALLRFLHCDHPHARISPGIRTPAGDSFMAHILDSESEKVEANGLLNIPLSTVGPEAFLPKEDADAR